MDWHLIVTSDFGDKRRGDRIEDADMVAAVLAGEQRHNVVKVRAPAAPAPEAELEPALLED